MSRTVLEAAGYEPADVGELRHVQIDVGSALVMSTASTDEQKRAVIRLAHNHRHHLGSIQLTPEPFDLPPGYILFVLREADGSHVLTGGIDPEGAIST